MSNSFASPSTPRPSSRTRSTGTPPVSSSGPATRRTRSASNRSLPAETGVWIVKTLSRRTAAQASSIDILPATYSRARSASRNAEWPSFRCQTAGASPSCRIARTPPMPRTSSWWRRISRPRTYRMLVIGRSASAFSGRSVSSSRTGTRPTCASQTATWRSRPGSSTFTVSGPPRRVLDPAERQSAQVVVGVVVLLVAVGIDRLAEVALAIEQPDADRGQGHVAGRLHVVAGEDPEPARVDPERLVEAVFGAEVGDRALERLAVAALEPVAGAVGHVVVEVGQDVVVFGQEARVIEQARPIGRAADDGDRVPVARPRRAVDGAEQRAGSRVPGPVEVVGEASKTFEPGREREARSRLRGDADGVHEAASYPVAQRVNRFRCPARDAAAPTPERAARTMRTMPMRVAMLASECEPWAKTGGLADVVDALGARAPRPRQPGAGDAGRRLPAALPGRARAGAYRADAGAARPGPARAVRDQHGDRARCARRWLPIATGRPSGRLRSRRLLRRRGRRLPGQRVAVRAVLPRCSRGAPGR